MFLTSSFLYDFVGVVTALLLVGYVAIKWRFRYWANKGLLTEPTCVPFGTMTRLFLGLENMGIAFAKPYQFLRRNNKPFGGAFMGTKEMFIVTDPDLIKQIMLKDFNHFVNHGGFIDEETDPLSGHLFALEDDKWRNLRNKLSPTFTSGKMKMMFPTLADVADRLKEVISESAQAGVSVNVKDVSGCFTTDIIGSCAFGLECNSLSNPDNEFRKHGKLAIDFDWKDNIKALMSMILPKSVLRAINFKITKPEVTTFFMDMVQKTVNYREKNNIYRKDFMHLMLQIKNMGKLTEDEKISEGQTGEHHLTVNEMAAQAFVFFVAGFETSSTTMSFALYELAANLAIQEKLREEIKATLKTTNGKLTYDAIMEMKYLDQVVNETLRKHPAAPVLVRECNLDYPVPNSDIVLKKGTAVAISSFGLHYDQEYYPNPIFFDPDRFTEENKAKRPHFTYLPFGEGPRHCIGMRFGLMQTKVGLVTLLNNFEVTFDRKTRVPLEYDTTQFILSAKDGIWLNFKRVSEN